MTEENIRIQKEKYQNIIDNMNLGLLEVDLEERIQYANPGFCKLSGYDHSELIGKKLLMFLFQSRKKIIDSKTPDHVEGISDLYEILVKIKQ